MKFKFTYLLTYLLTLVVFTSCDSNDLFEERKSEEIELASRATSSFLVSVDEAKGIAMKKLRIRINPCDFVHLPLFTQLEANNVITINDDIIVYNNNEDGTQVGTYHSGGYYNRSMVAYVIP